MQNKIRIPSDDSFLIGLCPVFVFRYILNLEYPWAHWKTTLKYWLYLPSYVRFDRPSSKFLIGMLHFLVLFIDVESFQPISSNYCLRLVSCTYSVLKPVALVTRTKAAIIHKFITKFDPAKKQ